MESCYRKIDSSKGGFTMKNQFLMCSALIFLFVPAFARCDEPNSVEIQWAPTLENMLEKDDIKMLVFFEDDTPCIADFEEAHETARIVDLERIENVFEAFSDSQRCVNSEDCAYSTYCWMGIVNSKNQGVLTRMSWNHIDETVEWLAHKSSALYEVLYKYGVIEPPAQIVYVNEPNAVFFEEPPIEQTAKPEIISFRRKSDLDRVYNEIDPKKYPIFIQVDPNTPKVYVPVETGSSGILLDKLIPTLDILINCDSEMAIQNRWLQDNLDLCLSRLEAQNGLHPIETEPYDSFNFQEPLEPNDLPYDLPRIRDLPPTNEVARLIAVMNLHAMGTNTAKRSMQIKAIEFKQRLQRLGISVEEINH
jgi:hypothetical protein